MTIILVAGGYFLDLGVKSTKRMKLSVLFLVKSHFSNRQFMKMFSWNHHSYRCILQGVTHNYLLPWLPHWISKMANHGMCDGKCCPSRLYLLQFFLQISHIWTINKTLQNVFETIVNKKKEHMLLGTTISILDCQNGHLLWLILQIGNYLRYNRDFCIFLWVKYSDVSMAIEFICKGVMK